MIYLLFTSLIYKYIRKNLPKCSYASKIRTKQINYQNKFILFLIFYVVTLMITEGFTNVFAVKSHKACKN